MTPRQRMLAMIDFAGPDRLPLVYHPSTAGLHVHGQPLLELFQRYPSDNPIVFDALPRPPAEGFGPDGRYRAESTDAWGTTWEFNIFGVAGQAIGWPLADLSRLSAYRFPPPPTVNEPERERVARLKERYLLFGGGLSIFERLCALRPMEAVLLDLAGGDKAQLRLLDRLTQYWLAHIEYLTTTGYDVISFGDDWGQQHGPLVSPALFDRVFAPRYRVLFDAVKRGGARVFFHSCGTLGPLLERLLDLGIDGLWHQVNRYDELALARRCQAAGVFVYVHPDRQYLVPRGTPAEIEACIRWYAETYHALGGGAVFYVEIENDAPWENVVALFEAIDRYR